MTVVGDLLAAIYADPHDDAPQLVIADWLLARDDPRGELIVLDLRERTSELADPAALERLLLLAAEYTFPRPTEVVDEPLPFFGGDVVRAVHHAGRDYEVRCRDRRLGYRVNGGGLLTYPGKLELAGDTWNDDERTTILTLFSDAIRAGTPLDALRIPYLHPALPRYDGGPLRAYALPDAFTGPRGIDRFHYGLAARDYHRWHAIWARLRG
jgi:uncharacterized protein (TIGR02996 family)